MANLNAIKDAAMRAPAQEWNLKNQMGGMVVAMQEARHAYDMNIKRGLGVPDRFIKGGVRDSYPALLATFDRSVRLKSNEAVDSLISTAIRQIVDELQGSPAHISHVTLKWTVDNTVGSNITNSIRKAQFPLSYDTGMTYVNLQTYSNGRGYNFASLANAATSIDSNVQHSDIDLRIYQGNAMTYSPIGKKDDATFLFMQLWKTQLALLSTGKLSVNVSRANFHADYSPAQLRALGRSEIVASSEFDAVVLEGDELNEQMLAFVHAACAPDSVVGLHPRASRYIFNRIPLYIRNMDSTPKLIEVTNPADTALGIVMLAARLGKQQDCALGLDTALYLFGLDAPGTRINLTMPNSGCYELPSGGAQQLDAGLPAIAILADARLVQAAIIACHAMTQHTSELMHAHVVQGMKCDDLASMANNFGNKWMSTLSGLSNKHARCVGKYFDVAVDHSQWLLNSYQNVWQRKGRHLALALGMATMNEFTQRASQPFVMPSARDAQRGDVGDDNELIREAYEATLLAASLRKDGGASVSTSLQLMAKRQSSVGLPPELELLAGQTIAYVFRGFGEGGLSRLGRWSYAPVLPKEVEASTAPPAEEDPAVLAAEKPELDVEYARDVRENMRRILGGDKPNVRTLPMRDRGFMRSIAVDDSEDRVPASEDERGGIGIIRVAVDVPPDMQTAVVAALGTAVKPVVRAKSAMNGIRAMLDSLRVINPTMTEQYIIDLLGGAEKGTTDLREPSEMSELADRCGVHLIVFNDRLSEGVLYRSPNAQPDQAIVLVQRIGDDWAGLQHSDDGVFLMLK